MTSIAPRGLTLLLTSPRVAPGLLSRDAWLALDAADSVLARSLQDPLAAAVIASGIEVRESPGDPPTLARRLGDGDPGLSDAIAAEVTRLEDPPAVEILSGSWDVPGSRLLDVVAVMDRLRSPGGCPWDAEQSHASLAPYLIEEAQECLEAIASGDRANMAEELGDVLLQVAFHSRVAQEDPQAPFDIDDVAAGLVAKLVRRHPHVFADATADTPLDVEAQWAVIKAQEKADKAAGRAAATPSSDGPR